MASNASWVLMLLYVWTRFLLLRSRPFLLHLLSHQCSLLPPRHCSGFLSLSRLPLSKCPPTPSQSSSYGEKFSLLIAIEIHVFRSRILSRERPFTQIIQKYVPRSCFFLKKFKTQLKRHFLYVTDSDSLKNLIIFSALSKICSVCSAGY